jgi:hypothetical protein
MSGSFRLLAALALSILVAGCGGEEVWAPEAEVQRAAYSPDGPPSVTLLTMVSNVNGSGGHSALVIDGAQRLVFDPAGSWHHPMVPERNDVLFGMSPQLFDFYMDYHARETYRVVVQEVPVTPAQAGRLSALVQSAGPVPRANCTRAIAGVLRETPGFERLGQTWFPNRLRDDFAALPGVAETVVYDDDSDDNLELLQAQARAARTRDIAAQVTGN